MATRIVGLDIGDGSIRAAEVTAATSSRPALTKLRHMPLPHGAVRGGEVIEHNTVVTALKQLWADGKFKSRRVVLGMGNQKVMVRELTVQRAPLEQIKQGLPFHVQEMLPVPVDDALLDFYPATEAQGEHGPVVNGLLIAAVKEAVVANVKAVEAAGLTPAGVDLIPFALYRALVPNPTEGEIVAVIDVGSTTTNVVIARGHVPLFVRIVPMGGDDVTKALVRRLELDAEDADTLKRRLGLALEGVAPEDVHAVEVIREATNELLRSISNTLAYFSHQQKGAAIDRMFLVGGGAQLSGFSEALMELTRAEVRDGDVFVDLKVPDTVRESVPAERSHSFATALGLVRGAR
ncbi:type IV pilus assembly protein PilM [Ruicaihuangia caeni]|uniref:type IV pilus assembly protein PilM n=1 Tax=Ruicaihuangia caeni TaxID=3042517 RepID=UPI00338E4315